MDKTLTAITDFAVSTTFDELPANVIARARDCLVDSLGCSFGGRTSPGARVAEHLVHALGSTGQLGSVIGHPLPAVADLAAMWNTSMIRYLDFNDTYPGGHPSDMLGGLIALAGPAGATGRQMITALVVAYETFIRLSDTVNMRNRAIDQGFSIAVGTVAGAINLLGLSANVGRQALSIVACNGLPLRATRAGELSDLKGTATALAVQNAVRMIWMAQAGLTGPEAPLDGRHGVLELIEGRVAPIEMPAFDRWMILRMRLKFWPVAYNMQATIWAGLELRDRLDWRALDRLVIHTDRFSHHESGSEPAKWDPQTRETADHSLPYVLARILQHGTLDAAFEDDAIRDPATREVMWKIEVVADEELTAIWPSVMGVRLEATTKSGKTEIVSLRDAKGHDRNPLTPDDIRAKFRALSEPLLGPAWERGYEAAWNVERADRFGDVLDALLVA